MSTATYWKTLQSRDGQKIDGVVPATSNELEALLDLSTGDSAVLGAGSLLAIDEAQFFRPSSLLRAVDHVLNTPGAHLLLSGLDLDFRGEEFGGLMQVHRALQEAGAVTQQGEQALRPGRVVRLHSSCTHGAVPGSRGRKGAGGCGAAARLTQRLERDEPAPPAGGGESDVDVVAIGDADMYQPSCDHHHEAAPVRAEEWFRLELGNTGSEEDGLANDRSERDLEQEDAPGELLAGTRQ